MCILLQSSMAHEYVYEIVSMHSMNCGCLRWVWFLQTTRALSLIIQIIGDKCVVSLSLTVLLSLFQCNELAMCLCVYLFVFETVLVHCVFGRECNNCLRLIPECDELSVPVKYLARSPTLSVCSSSRCNCVLVHSASSHCVFAVLLYAIPISQWPTSVNCMGCQ